MRYLFVNTLQSLDKERAEHHTLQITQQKTALSLADVKTEVQMGNYKIENYDRVKRSDIL